MMSKLPDENLKEKYILDVSPFANFGIENLLSRYLKNVTAGSLKLYQLIEDNK